MGSHSPEPMTAIARMKKGDKAWVQFGDGGSISSWEDGHPFLRGSDQPNLINLLDIPL